jgi:uncharacterized protein (DUF885 family)
MNPRAPIVLALALSLAPCLAGSQAATAPSTEKQVAAPAAEAGQRLNAMFERYFEEYLELNPLDATQLGDNRYNDRLPNYIGPEYRAQVHEMNERYLAAVQEFDPAQLSGEDRISYEIFLRERLRERESERFPDYLLPLGRLFGLQETMPALGSGTNAQPFVTVTDYENWLKRLDGFVVFMDQAIVNMREGVAKGIVQPRPIMEKVLPQLDGMIVAKAEDSAFFAPVSKFPDTVPVADRERLTAAYRTAIEDKVIPAYRRVRDFVRDEYMPKTRTTVAWTALPDGKAWYAYLVRGRTTTDMTPEEIHKVGLGEVARIRDEMDAVRRQVGFEGDLGTFFRHLESDPQFYFTQGSELVQGYRELKVRIDAALPKLFSVFPKADYQVREVEAFRAETAASAFYEGASADGSRPGIFYVNTFDLRAQPKFGMETLSLHEASPGHHFQDSIAQELTGLPKFRRFEVFYTAYAEGWALYAEYLGKELGMFTDPYQWFGRLNDEQLRAMRLVVDTGLHSLGWSREQAIGYMVANSSMSESSAASEVDRYISWPGQALAYKIGDLRIQALRRNAEKELGAKFDIRDFHREVLSDGAVPMDVLEAKIARWVAARK